MTKTVLKYLAAVDLLVAICVCYQSPGAIAQPPPGGDPFPPNNPGYGNNYTFTGCNKPVAIEAFTSGTCPPCVPDGPEDDTSCPEGWILHGRAYTQCMSTTAPAHSGSTQCNAYWTPVLYYSECVTDRDENHLVGCLGTALAACVGACYTQNYPACGLSCGVAPFAWADCYNDCESVEGCYDSGMNQINSLWTYVYVSSSGSTCPDL